MTIVAKVMRFLAPACEKQRMELRKARACVDAHVEDLNRTIVLDATKIREVLRDEKQQKLHMELG